jgi:sugar lactone lactonase YvrE
LFIAVSSPSRLLYVAPEAPAVAWHAVGDEKLIAALLPDSGGGVYYGLSPSGLLMHAASPTEVREIAETESLFIWALASSPDGSIWVGTGLPGKLLRLDREGTLETMFESGEDPVRCIVALADGSIVFGTGGRGRVVRVDPTGKPEVLFDADEAEIVAVEATESGTVFALAAQGSKQVTAGRPPSHPAPQASVRVTASAPAQEENGGESEGDEPQPDPARRGAQPPRFTTPPGGTLYRIEPDGDFQRIWQAANEVPFGLTRLDDGTLLVATGDSGRIHAVQEDGDASVRAQLPSDQASALSRDADGTVLVGGTTDARVARLGPTLRERGSYVSAVHDAGAMADWGRLVVDAERPSGSGLTVAVRGGNTAEPDETWGDWSTLAGDSGEGVETGLAPSRWAQARIQLEPSARAGSPRVGRIELYYQPRNRRPEIAQLIVHPAGVVWTANPTPTARPIGPVVASDPVARRTMEGLRPAGVRARPVRKVYELGGRTLSWTAADTDGDELRYRVEIRREGKATWIPLADGIEEQHYSFDARGLPDGLYRARLVADDSPGNPEGKQLQATRVSGAFRVDNTRPSVSNPRVGREQGSYELRFVASDPGGSLAAAEVAVDGGAWEPIDPVDGVADSPEERYELRVAPEEDREGPPTVRVRVTDSAGNMGGDAWALDDEE